MSSPFIEFVHPDDRERTLKQNAAVRGGGQALAFENRYMCKEESYISRHTETRFSHSICPTCAATVAE